MILLDTDHLTVHAFPDSRAYGVLSPKIRNTPDEFGTTIVCLEEQLRGWLAAIKRKHDVDEQVPVYDQLGKLWDYFRDWQILRFDAQAAELFKRLRRQKIRIGSQDLKISRSPPSRSPTTRCSCPPICAIFAKSLTCASTIGCCRKHGPRPTGMTVGRKESACLPCLWPFLL